MEAKPQLLPNWNEVYDGESGQVYYWNSVTDETQWDAPLAPTPSKQYAHTKERAEKIGARVSGKLSTRERLEKLARLRAYRNKRRAAAAGGAARAGAGGAGAGGAGAGSGAGSGARKPKRPKKPRAVIVAETYSKDEKYVKRVYPKSDTTRALLCAALKQSFIFDTLSAADIEEVVDAMKERRCAVGDKVIVQNETGDNFYIVENGEFDILINGVGKVATRGANSSFGEKALLYNCPRAATVQATTPALLWALDRVTFRHMIAHTTEDKMAAIISALRAVPILESLTESQLTKVADAVQMTEYHAGDVIIRKGDQGDTFFMVKSGEVLCTQIESRGEAVPDLPLGAGTFFGERALLLSEPRAANVIAQSEVVTCMELGRKDFTELLGSLHELLDAQMTKRVLSAIPALSHLTDAQRASAVGGFTIMNFTAGTRLADEGAPATAMLVIKEGQAEASDGVSLRAGDYFGAEALSGGGVTPGLFATTNGSCFKITRAAFQSALSDGDAEERKKEEKKKVQAESAAARKKDRDGIRFEDLEVMRVLGAGTFGLVKLTRHTPTGKPYALKMMQKSRVVDYKQTKNVMNEKNVMAMVDHPFVLKLAATFQDRDSLYMLLELVGGGELFSLLADTDEGFVPVDQAKFYAACVILGLEHLHSMNILYRDLKPENLLLDAEGYIKIVDMGFAKVVEDRTYTLCGTPEYLAPELVIGKGHHKGVDYWATGILIYEMLCGYSPFADDDGDQLAICKNIVKAKLRFASHLRDKAAKDLITKLLKRDVVQRYGCRKRGAAEIRDHKWFKKSLDFDQLYAKTIPAPWLPDIKDPFDVHHFDAEVEEEEIVPYFDDGVAESSDGRPWFADF